ncbi:Uncharacterised protein [Segatella copri]|nr:Uncharacterised protein [Segatella copri]
MKNEETTFGVRRESQFVCSFQVIILCFIGAIG